LTADPALLTARGIASFGLPTSRFSCSRLSDEDWAKVISKIRTHKLCGLAVAAAEEESLGVTDEQFTELLAIQRSMMVHALQVEKKLFDVGNALNQAGVDFVVLKGPAFANSLYADPAWRPFSDLDLMVTTANWRNACSVLAAEGYERVIPEPHEGFDERFGKAAAHRASNGFEIDLHRTLVLGPFGLWLDPDELLTHTTYVWIGGRQFLRLDDTGSLINACLHAALGARPPFLMALRDVVQIAESPDVDWDLLAEWSRRWRLGAALRYAFETAAETLDVPVPDEAAAIIAAPTRRSEVRALDSYTTDRRGRGGMALSTLKAIPGFRGKLAYISCLLVPNEEFLAARAAGRDTSLWRRWRIPLRWAKGRLSRSQLRSTRIEERTQ
jgi:Uncharacterised nucleotidyltransferase